MERRKIVLRWIKKHYTSPMNVIDQEHSSLSEQFRTLRTNLKFVTEHNDTKTIVVSSPNPNEGKTVLAINLATVLGQEGKNVLLVDGNLRNPSINHILKLINNNGLTNYLAGEKEFEKIVKFHSAQAIWLATSGPLPPSPLDLLNSSKLEHFIELANGLFDIVVIDTPSILAYPDASIISRLCDGVLLVGQSGRTDSYDLIKAKEQLEKTGAKIIGAVLNRWHKLAAEEL
jgi:protein-tyrosine kinase